MEKSLQSRSTRSKTVELVRIKTLFHSVKWQVKASNIGYYVEKTFPTHKEARKAFLALSSK